MALNGTWNNNGVATIGGSARVNMSGGTINNLAGGTLNLASSTAYPFYFVTGTNAVNNAGTLTQQASGTTPRPRTSLSRTRRRPADPTATG